MSEQTPIAEVRHTWEAAATGYAKWDATLAAGLDEITQTMLNMAGISKDMRVLDLACGTGSQTLATAERVGSGGLVVANDISETMLEVTRDRVSGTGLKNVETLCCAAEDLPPMAQSFDAAICRLGLMLFPEPESALSAVNQALKPMARLAALVFSTPAANPFMAEPMEILLRHAGKQSSAPGAPGIFALGAPGQFAHLMRSTGYSDIETRIVRAPLHVASAQLALEMMRQAFGAYRAVIVDLDEGARAAAWAEVGDCLEQWDGRNGFRAEREFVIAAGAQSG